MSSCCAVPSSATPTPVAITCPGCGGRSKHVDLLTVKSLVRQLRFGETDTQYYFCPAANCDAVYFTAREDGPIYHRSDLLVRVGSKEEHGPITVCYCFGVTQEDLDQEARQAENSVLAGKVKAEVEAGRCACEVKNPSGKCCLGDIARALQTARSRVAAETH